MKPVRIRTGLIGLGNSGYFYHCRPHLEASDRFELVAVCTRGEVWAADVARRIGANIFTDWRKLIVDDRVELVVISTPHSLHYEMVHAAISAGKHVLVEKPMTTSTAEADDLIDLAGTTGVVLAVHQQRRFEHDFTVLRQLVSGGAIGELWKADIVRTHRGRYRAASADQPHAGGEVLEWPHERAFGGGISWLVAPHPVDQLLELVSAPSRTVAGRTHTVEGDEVEDFIGIDVEFSTGVAGRVEVFRHAGIAPPRFAVYGTEGTIVGRDGRELEVSAVGREPLTISGLTSPSVLGAEIYGGVYAAVREGGELAVTPEEARDAVEVLELALSSAGAAGKPIATRPRAQRMTGEMRGVVAWQRS